MAGYRLSAAAAKDLTGIKHYSVANFGLSRANAYLQDMRDRMRWLAVGPRRGKARGDLLPGLFSYRQDSHVIYYRVGKARIEIVRVLHQRMDPLRHLTQNEG